MKSQAEVQCVEVDWRKRYNKVIPKDLRLELKALNLTPEELYNFTNE